MRINDSLTIHKLGKVYMIADSCADNSNLATVYTLNATAGWLWLQAEGKDFTVDSLAEMLCGEFDVEPSRAKADVTAIVDRLKNFGLISE